MRLIGPQGTPALFNSSTQNWLGFDRTMSFRWEISAGRFFARNGTVAKSGLLDSSLSPATSQNRFHRLSPEAAADIAISGTPEEQERALLDLTRRGKPALPSLRRVAAESKNPGVRANALQALGGLNDIESMPMLLSAMEDDDVMVRGRAGSAATMILGADYFFRAEDPPQKRKAILGAMRKSYQQLLKNPELRK